MTSKAHKSSALSKVIPAKDDTAGARAFPVVAIGASAGGLEAYKELFHALPPDTGMAFVLVQHLDPSHHSLLAQILSKATRMPVDEVKSGTRLKPNCVYVIPPGAFMAIAAGAFTLKPRSKEAGQHLSVNLFMRSLAEDRRSGAIGIILSGTGADGTLGLEAIKAEGGITFAQEPATAKYGGMPRSAIDSGCVDFVLPPKEIAKELHRIRHHPYVHEDERGAEALSHTRSKESAGDKSEAKRLKREIVDAQEALRSAIESEDSLKEEFQSANEEILSANEELQSTNEELETSKEELQPANEELNTLNIELRLKNNEVHDVSNDISNLLNSMRIPVVMLDRGMSIRRFTPTADKLLKLRSSDIGRSLADIRPNIEVPELEQSVAKVLETLQPEEREVRDLQGHWHSLNILPYRTQDNKIDGVVIALQDIDAIKSANIQLTKSADLFRGIMNTVVEPLLVLDSELRVVMANEPFLTTFKVSPEGTLNRFVYSLGNGQWDIPTLRTLLEQVLPKHRRVRNFAVKHEFESIGVKTMLLNAETLSTVSDAEPMILLAIEDITERAQQEAALRESEERLHATLDTLPVAVYTTDAKGRLTHFNPASVALVGRTPDLGKDEWCVTWKLFRLDGTPLPHSECPMAVALKEDRDVPSEQLIAERPDGTRSWVEVYPTRLRNAEGRTTGGVNMIVDITERRQAEMKVRESEELFRTLFNSAPMAVFVCDRNAVIQNYNQRALDLWGRKPVCGAEKHCGSVRLWLPNGELLPHDQSPVIKVLRTGVPIYNVEVSIERPDGSRVPVLVNFAALKDAKGEITGAVTTFIDISEREEAELAMARLAAIVECSDDAIIGKDLNGIIESWNFGAERLFGYTQREAIGQPITLLFPTDRLYEEPIILERIRRGEHIEHYESVRRRKDGKLLEISLTVSPIVDARGKIVGASKIARDITERKLTEAALVKSEKLATAGRLAATLAHEINNPLQAVTNLVSLWRQSPGLDAEGQEYAAMAEEELNRVTHLTQQSLNFYREAVFPTAVDVADSVQKVLSLYTRRIEAKRISVTKRYAPDGTRIQSYPGEIRQVLSTLLLNAIEALPPGGTIAVHVGKASDWNDPGGRGVRISIADNGVGIPRHNTARIFEPFFTTKGENGTGLGLWVANGIINRLGGSIRVRSSVRPGKTGTCFSIFLPTRLPNK